MPIIYSNYKRTHTGLNVSGADIVGFIGDVPYGIQYYKSIELWEILVRDCGLSSYNDASYNLSGNGIIADVVGVRDGTSYLAQKFIGNNSTYCTLTESQNLGTKYTIKSNFDFVNVATATLLGDSNTNRWLVVDTATQIRHQLSTGNVVTLISDISFENKDVKIVRNDLSVQLFVDNALKDTKGFSTNESYLFNRLFVIGTNAFEWRNKISYLSWEYEV